MPVPTDGNLAAMQSRWPEVDLRVLSSHLRLAKDDLDDAIRHYEGFLAWRSALGPVSIASVEDNLRANNGKGPFMLTLEYEPEEAGKHPPIIMMQGMIKGTRAEMVKQGGGFRMPDADYRAAVFDVLHQYYPWMESSQVIFLDPLYVVKMALWGMGKIFGPSWKEKFVVGSKAAWPEGVKDPDVEKYMETTPGGRALGWEADGTIRYDMEEYIERRKEWVSTNVCLNDHILQDTVLRKGNLGRGSRRAGAMRCRTAGSKPHESVKTWKA
ncbi:hypothetical protein Naga_100032g16 [Nannochloropsis gaditana]|uniref:Uncharacterized protein n=1 Tax=Nannochloropsis gaditana TaxID=72520 RepID=W7TPX0_9STRA|nr:hypothetical protein Naga_100032g16 [Nannochloropsis gaditana]